MIRKKKSKPKIYKYLGMPQYHWINNISLQWEFREKYKYRLKETLKQDQLWNPLYRNKLMFSFVLDIFMCITQVQIPASLLSCRMICLFKNRGFLNIYNLWRRTSKSTIDKKFMMKWTLEINILKTQYMITGNKNEDLD